jgi:MFS family permease
MQKSIPLNFGSPILNPGFLKLLGYRFQIAFSYQIIAVVVGWHVYQLTHDPFALGLVGLAEVIPYFCSALFAGYIVDHYSRKRFGVIASILVALNALLLILVAGSAITDDPLPWIYAAIGAGGVARAFLGPSYSALFALVLQREHYASAAGIGTSVFQASMVLGPAAGGALVGWASLTTAYLVAMILALGASISLFLLKIEEPKPAQGAPVFTSIAEGLRFVFGNQIILGAQALDMFAVLFGGAVSMLPAFIHDVFRYGPEGLGILRAAPAIGAVITGILLAKRPLRQHAGRWLLIAVAGFGVCIILFALTPHFWLAAALLFLSGMFDGVSVVMRTTIMQLMTPDALRGRVAAINGIFIGSSNELGAFESGLAAKLMGLIPSVIFGGAMSLAIVAATAKLAPRLRTLNLDHLRPE